MSIIKKYKFELILFLVEAICMILEVVASRLLSPYFGSTNAVWTSVIAIILLSSSIGNYFGGKVADREDSKEKLKSILLISATILFIVSILQEKIITDISKFILNEKIGAMLATSVLFLIPFIFLGFIPPIILRLKIKEIDTVGRTSGRVNAIATVGSIFGTVLGGFFLVPNIGSEKLLLLMRNNIIFNGDYYRI